MSIEKNFIPCIIFAFNRPDKLRLVIEALKPQKIDHLIIFIDGPRDKLDYEKVECCRLIAAQIDWVDKEVYSNQKNEGLNGLISNIDKVFNRYQSAIFLEDDCLPMPTFYSFMKQALEYYKAEDKIFSICGYQYLEEKYFRNYPYSLISTWRFNSLGWATWQKRWAFVRPYISTFNELFDNLQNIPNIIGRDLKTTAKLTAKGETASWAVKVAVATFWLKKIHLLAIKGMVRNIGFDASGVHDAKWSIRFHNKNIYAGIEMKNIVWLKDIEPQKYYVKKIKQFYANITQPFWGKIMPRWFRRRLHFMRRFIYGSMYNSAKR